MQIPYSGIGFARRQFPDQVAVQRICHANRDQFSGVERMRFGGKEDFAVHFRRIGRRAAEKAGRIAVVALDQHLHGHRGNLTLRISACIFQKEN